MTDYDRNLIEFLEGQGGRSYEAARRLEELIDTLHQLKLDILKADEAVTR